MINAKLLTRLKVSFPPLLLLFLLLIFTIVVRLGAIRDVSNVMPFIILIAGIFVIVFGAFFDFGASQYMQNLIVSKSKIDEKTIYNINKEQAIMSLIYAGIGFLYILSGILIALL